MVRVIATEEYWAWFQSLPDLQARAMRLRMRLLESKGVELGYPYSSAVRGSSLPLRELRAESGGRPLRALYLFDRQRQAVLLVGGDKAGDSQFYTTFIARAEQLWAEYQSSRSNP